MDSQLPPMPGSDEESLTRNKYDGYYSLRARDFWKDNRVTRFEEPKYVKCDHEFIGKTGGAECKKCHFGLLGQIEVRSGKLFYKGDPIGL